MSKDMYGIYSIIINNLINFSLAGVRLLIEGSSYYFGAIPPPAIHKNNNAKDYLFRTALQITEIRLKNKQPRCLRTKPRTFSASN